MELKRKKIFFTSDLHLGHLNSIKFDERPFKDLDHMHRVIINNYNATVPEDGVCYFLGDIGFSNAEDTKKIINELNGTKIAILGNHDKNTYAMYDIGFDVVLNAGVFYIGKHRISMSHCPLPGIKREDLTNIKHAYKDDLGKVDQNWHGEHKNQRFTSYDSTVDFHLHGHIHSGPANTKEKYTDKQFDVGAPANKYRPVSISEIESWVDKAKKV